ncbi:Rrf2 family transcriptional regulator [Paenibacillus allorhizosphaerae]|uniref:HTH-type transcriptional regulator YwnA n=1 Tax=Paenibacillus allorhizosphaerae TaxID=2849866 RepID=A0ABN7TT41_9BACL|nr:Rrf2 family transcriptional regulator [Paenibacillus allorhizosphaerae]CAG7654775.1 Putative HTH-type transcriptional regulator YwnA [Paenibacillus allorhizosphaerae]
MYTNSQFAVAVHMMTILAGNYGQQRVNSELMARSVNTNPVIIRRILRKLVKGGLVAAVPGATGGSVLTRPPEQISLLDIYRIEGKQPVCLPENNPNPECLVGKSFKGVLCSKLSEAEQAMERKLAEVTIADLYTECAEFPLF